MNFLKAPPITIQAFAPFGWLIDAADCAGEAINGGTSQRSDGLTDLNFDAEGGRPCLAIFKAVARDPAGPWKHMERHRLGTQTFVPLNGVRYMVLVALGDLTPDVTTLRAFTVSGHQSVTLRAGTWHHGLLALEPGAFVVLERSSGSIDCELAQLTVPVSITLT